MRWCLGKLAQQYQTSGGTTLIADTDSWLFENRIFIKLPHRDLDIESEEIQYVDIGLSIG